MRVAALAGFSYPVKVRCYVNFERQIENGAIHWIADAPIRHKKLTEFERRRAEILRRVAAWLKTIPSDSSESRMLLVSSEIFDSVGRDLDLRSSSIVRSTHQDNNNEVRKALRDFLGNPRTRPEVSSDTLSRFFPKKRVLCVSEESSAPGFDKTLEYAGLKGRGIAFDVKHCSFSNRINAAAEIKARADQADCILYARNGLGDWIPPSNGRKYSGQTALDAVVSMLHSLWRAQEESESNSATIVQTKLQPRSLSADGADICASWRPFGTVSGDMFDFFELEDGSVVLMLVDVQGKGQDAALVAASVLGQMKECARRGDSPGRVLNVVHSSSKSRPVERLVPAFCAKFEKHTSKLTYANAGHLAPLVLHSTGSISKLDSSGRPLGSPFPGTIEEMEIRLQPGDRMVAFTDGFTDATCPMGIEFGEERIQSAVLQLGDLGIQSMADSIVELVNEYCGGEWNDDATLLVFSATPIKEGGKGISVQA